MDSTIENTDMEYQYFLDEFVKDRQGPYVLQWPGKSWSTKYKKVSDPLIQSHLSQKYWIGLKAPWYPRFGYIDVDQPDIGTFDRIKERMKFDEGQYLICTSPSYSDSGNYHILFRPRYQGKPCTSKLLHDILQPLTSQLCVELYPQKRRKFRLPFGKNQYIIDEELSAPLPYSWREALYWVKKTDEFELKGRIDHQLNFSFKNDKTIGWKKKATAEELLQLGLQPGYRRHESCFLLAQYFFRLNLNPNETSQKIKRWLRTKHNGLSKEVNRNNWNIIDKEIERQVCWVYEKYDASNFYPDSVHNLEGWITKTDLDLITKLFYGDVLLQKKMYRLIYFFRPRGAYYQWVYIPSWKWIEIAGKKHYKKLQKILAEKRILESINSYVPDCFPKRFKLTLPYQTKENMIASDGRSIQDFYQAIRITIGENIRWMADYSGIDQRNFYDDRRLIS